MKLRKYKKIKSFLNLEVTKVVIEKVTNRKLIPSIIHRELRMYDLSEITECLEVGHEFGVFDLEKKGMRMYYFVSHEKLEAYEKTIKSFERKENIKCCVRCESLFSNEKPKLFCQSCLLEIIQKPQAA